MRKKSRFYFNQLPGIFVCLYRWIFVVGIFDFIRVENNVKCIKYVLSMPNELNGANNITVHCTATQNPYL